MVQYALSISARYAVQGQWQNALYSKNVEIPVSDETYRGVVMEDDIVIEVRFGICILRNSSSSRYSSEGNDWVINFSM